MSSRTLTILLLIAIGLGVLALFPKLEAFNLPGNNQGYEPVQPIAFSHRLHAGELSVPCLYCHSAAEQSRHAGIPSAGLCMNCHRFVTAPIGAVRQEDDLARKEKRDPRRVMSPELRKLFEALALDDSLKPDAARRPRPIEWIRVHNLPDFAYFDHRRHVTAGVSCQTCHGPVETMERIVQVGDLSMGWCVNCHRDATRNGIDGRAVNAVIDCAACHY